MIKVKVYNESGLPLPKYETEGSAGMDVCAKIDVELPGNETKLIPTGLFVQIPGGYEIQVRPRSGVSLKTGLRVANAPGTVDSDYRGEICVIMTNTSQVHYNIKQGERVAQLVLSKVPQISWMQCTSKEELTDTYRGSGGFGSTGQ